MPESTPINPSEPGFEIATSFVRNRNVLLAKADFGDLYVDYYLHLSEHRLKPAEEHDALFKAALAAFALHCASRPWNELIAWTLHFEEPFVNLFLTGDNETGAITGRVFTENVKASPTNLFYSDVVRAGQPKRRSTVSFTGSDPFRAVEALYAQSEQRPARYFQTGEEEFVMVVEHPDCDQAWFENLSLDVLKDLSTAEVVTPMERRVYRWHCGCNHARMLQVLAPVAKQGLDELFEGDESIEVRCPRCAARHNVSRESLAAYLSEN